MNLATTPPDAPITFVSSSPLLNDGFEWARLRALEWVQTKRLSTALPSYWAGLTDRPMFYSRDVTHQALGAHLLGLDEENFAMIRHFARSATQRRGWYPLWAFTFDGEPAAIDYHSDDDFVREVPAAFELTQIALEQRLWTGEDRWLADSDLAAYYRRSLGDFVRLHDIRGDGVAGAHSARDIFAGSPTYNEAQTTPDIQVAADGIASQWAAVDAYARIAADDDERLAFTAEAARLRELFDLEWWDAGAQRYLTGFDPAGPVLGNGLEAVWFPAVKGLIADPDRAKAHLSRLTDLLRTSPPRNIEALTYVPEAYLNYGEDDEARRWIHYLLESRDDYPEVSFTAIAHLASGLTGLVPVADGAISTRSHLRDDEWAEAGTVRIGTAVVTIRHDGRNSSELTVHSSPSPIRWTARFGDGSVTTTNVPTGTTARLSSH
ncbi:hypothetical protein ABH923_002900 [Leifsonia sp. EB41]|uniref:hypothetical protein n=1 Tax=Leifsonia sp. EB41 TaxID=3156260 RepID=UPI003516EC68